MTHVPTPHLTKQTTTAHLLQQQRREEMSCEGEGRDGRKRRREGVSRLVEKFCFREDDNKDGVMAEAAEMEGRRKERRVEEKGLPLVGVSLRWFLKFGRKEKMMRGLGEKMKRMTMERSETVVEMLQRTQSQFVKEVADIYISYSGDCSVKEVVGTLKKLLPPGKNEGDVFIWMDVLVMNWHKMGCDRNYWMNSIQDVINKIGRIAVILTPWDNPINLTRSWCLWEMYCATQNENAKVEIIIPPSQRNTFRHALRFDVFNLFSKIRKIDLMKSNAFDKMSQEMILNAARTAKDGIEAVQESMIGPIRKWVTREATTLIDELEVKGDNLGELALVCNQVGMLLSEQGLYDVQEQYSRKAVELSRKHYGDDHPSLAASLNALAVLLDDQGKYGEAEAPYRESLAIDKRILGDDHPNVAISLFNIATLLSNQGKSTEAEAMYREALAIYKKAYGNDHTDVADCLNAIAGLLQGQGKYEEAEVMYREALAIYKKNNEQNHPSLASILSGLALLLQAQGKYDESESLYQKSLTIKKKAFGNNHQSVASSLDDIATLLDYQGKYEESESLFREVLAMRKKALGDEHPDVASSLNNFASLFQSQGKYEEAEGHVRMSLEILKKSFGNSHPKIATGLARLASILNDVGKLDEAEKVCEEALEMRKRLFQGIHPDIAIILSIQAKIDFSRNKLEDAESNARTSMKMFRSVHRSTPDHRDIAESLFILAKVLQAKKDNTAREIGRQSLEMFERALGATHPRTIKARIAIQSFNVT